MLKKYKVVFSGFAYVEAEDSGVAVENYEDTCAYMETCVDDVEEVEEFVITV